MWRYPAKSMMGDSFSSLPVGENGVVGDRGWAVRDESRGGIRGAKQIGGLMRLHARYVDEPQAGATPPAIEVRLPDGGLVRSDDHDVDARLSAALDHPVTLWPLQPAADVEHYRRGAPDSDDFEAELRAIFAREPDEPLPSFEGMPMDVLMEFESPPGSYFDAFPLMIVTDRTLDSLAAKASGSNFDVRRFRPNVVVEVEDDGGDDFPEQSWIGRRLLLGELELEIAATCPRCVMVTRDFADLPADREIMRAIVREAGQNVGVYARIARPAPLDVGAEVVLD
jgi:hypothetical protein